MQRSILKANQNYSPYLTCDTQTLNVSISWSQSSSIQLSDDDLKRNICHDYFSKRAQSKQQLPSQKANKARVFKKPPRVEEG